MENTTTKQDWKILEDTDAVDASLPSLLLAPMTRLKACGDNRHKVVWSLAAIALSAIYVYGAMMVSGLGMDWGYYLVKAFVGQPSGDDQWLGAVLLQTWAAPAIYGAMAIAVSKRTLGGRKIWWLVLAAPIVAALGSASIIMSDNFLEALPLIGITATLFIACFHAFYWVIAELAKRTRVVRLMLCPLPAFAVALAMDALGKFDSNTGIDHLDLFLNIAKYAFIFFGSGVLVRAAVKTMNPSAAICASIFAFLPNLVFCSVNLLVGSFFTHGWHAALSGILIMVVTLAATTSGAALEPWIVQRKLSNRV